MLTQFIIVSPAVKLVNAFRAVFFLFLVFFCCFLEKPYIYKRKKQLYMQVRPGEKIAGRTGSAKYHLILAKIILPAAVCSTLVTVTSMVSPTRFLAPSTTIMVPSSR